KAWFDLVHTDPRIGGLSTALAGRPATLVTCLGGNYDPGSPKEGWDHSTPWLRRVLEDVWQLDLRVVRRSFTLVGVKPELDAFTQQPAGRRAAAAADARRLGQDTAQARACHPVACPGLIPGRGRRGLVAPGTVCHAAGQATRAPGSVKFRAGGDSPRPARLTTCG